MDRGLSQHAADRAGGLPDALLVLDQREPHVTVAAIWIGWNVP